MTTEIDIALLNKVADCLCENPYGLMGSEWKKIEAEEIATEIIISCRDNFSVNEDAFAWAKLTQKNGCPITVNHVAGLKILLSQPDKAIVIKDYNGDLIPPANTFHKNGIPQILRITNELLEYAEKLIG